MTFSVEVDGRPVTRLFAVELAGREGVPFNLGLEFDVAEGFTDRSRAEQILRWLLDRDVDAELVAR